jgi:cytochrome bd-type quinol oxidase subunit 2
MKKMTKKEQTNILQLADVGALVLALWFVYSVINNARDLIEKNIKNAPASYALILALVLCGFTWYRRKKLSTWSAVVLSILATAAAIWLFGLSTRSGY